MSETVSNSGGSGSSLKTPWMATDIRKRVLAVLGIAIFGVFVTTLRYPQLMMKASQVDSHLVSLVYSSELIPVLQSAPTILKILYGSINWLWSMKVGMTFGLFMGALLHTLLQLHPFRFGDNTLVNQIKGILIGAPSGICVNCAVPVACGIFRTRSVPLETLFAFMLSAPTFNVIVIFMVFSSLPWFVGVLHYGSVALMLFVVTPAILHTNRLSGRALPNLLPSEDNTMDTVSSVSDLVSPDGTFPNAGQQVHEVLSAFGKHLWTLTRATIPFMLMAGVLSAAMMQWIPFETLLADVTLPKLGLIAAITTLLPVPIALDVMVANHLNLNGVHIAYSFLFLSTLGTYSILPMIFLWREVSKPIAFQLLLAFSGMGFFGACLLNYFL